MTGPVGGAVWTAPAGTPPDAAGAWSYVGYAADAQLDTEQEYKPGGLLPARPLLAEVEFVLPLSIFRRVMPRHLACRITALTVEGWYARLADAAGLTEVEA
ncbi:hypothetical protein [Streptomyces sp. NPDC001068]|uniref:hypothetical protein n=1 Tax=Streptomyces sp. NPDC001068 TaxID=3364544 RepID=UPI00368A8DD5